MRILEIVFSLTSGGAERFVVDLCNRYASDDGNEVILLSLLDVNIKSNGYYMQDLSEKVRHINSGGKKGYSLSNLFKVYETIKRCKPDIVHAHCGFLVLLLPAILCRKTVYVHTIHSLVERYAPGWAKKNLSKFLYHKGLIQPVTISATCHHSYYNYYRLSNDICISNGREQINKTNEFNRVKRIIEEFKNNVDDPVFIHVARHHPVKNHERLFKTFERLEKEGFAYLLIVVGDNYGELENKYKKHRSIHLVGPKKNVGDYLALSDYFVLTSDAEGLPLTLLEAMSMGVIPICTPAGGIKDVIHDGINGYVAKDFSDEDFYKVVTIALSERGKIKKEVPIRDYLSSFSMKVCAEKYMDLYRKLMFEKNV